MNFWGTLVWLVGLLLVGGWAGRWSLRRASELWHQRLGRAANGALTVCLYVLLFTMGYQSGRIPQIEHQLLSLGLMAVLAAVFSLGGCIVLVGGVQLWRGRAEAAVPAEASPVPSWGQRLKTPALYGALVVLGFGVGLKGPELPIADLPQLLLSFLLLIIGTQMGLDPRPWRRLLLDPIHLLLPALTVAGTLLGGCALALASSYSWGQALAVVAGLGWYSLSGVLITSLGDPVLGSTAFLANLFRESLAFFLIPLLASSRRPWAAVSVAGATSMDTTLPLLKQSCGAGVVPLSLTHGIVLSLAVPVLVPLTLAFR